MFVQTSSRRIINTEHIVEIKVTWAVPEHTEFDEEEGRVCNLPVYTPVLEKDGGS